jgi:alpha-beta hydrolase superfamily lysophospholipase
VRYTDPVAITDRSSPVPMPRTAEDVVTDLHALLAAAQVPGPYLLVAHSLGGLFARLYAQSYPDQVRSLFFVDAFPALRPQTTHIVATGSDHYIQVHQPDLVMAITELLIERSAQSSR